MEIGINVAIEIEVFIPEKLKLLDAHRGWWIVSVRVHDVLH